MVFVKVRETYDVQTTKNKMTVIGVHTPKADIIKQNFPGLLMQCKTYRPYSCDVVVACASALPVDPLGVGLEEGSISPEDMFNPILYRAMTNQGMSQLEKRITYIRGSTTDAEIIGSSASIDVDSLTSEADEFPLYYGLLSNSHGWKTANPQQGLVMKDLVPLVYEVLATDGENQNTSPIAYNNGMAPTTNGAEGAAFGAFYFKGNAKRMPMINTTTYGNARVASGFNDSPANHEGTSAATIPAPVTMCACIIIPPSRLQELFFRMTVEWTLEFSSIRPIGEIAMWSDVAWLGQQTHYQNYDYTANSKALGVESELTHDTSLVDTNVNIKKVM